MSMPNVPLSAIVRDNRVALGMSQEELAEKVGKSQGWVAKIESGEIKYPRRKTLERLAFVLPVNFTDLYIAAGYASTKADADRIASAPYGQTERTMGDRLDDVEDLLSDGERASIDAILRSIERAKRKAK